MINVCLQCGNYRADKIVNHEKRIAICPECHYEHPFRFLPLFVVSGASGTGKTTVCNILTQTYQKAVCLDSDILWREEFATPENNFRDFFETWLRVCKNIAQAGRPVVLFGAGMGVPDNLETCVERRYFTTIHYLALMCNHDVLISRLQQRPEWRGTRDPEYIQEHSRFNQWFLDYNNDPPISLIDTSATPLKETSQMVADWIQHAMTSQ